MKVRMKTSVMSFRHFKEALSPSSNDYSLTEGKLLSLTLCLSLFLYFLTLLSCSSPSDQQLESALRFAGSNRQELERVLSHYKEEPEKLEAAKFLIRNMPRYFSYECAKYDSIKQVLLTVDRGHIADSVVKKWQYYPEHDIKKIYDAHVITAKYLIKNIDLAFHQWKTRPWNKNLSFDDFCQYILPYRIEFEPLEDWREAYYNKFSPVLDSLYQGTDIIEAIRCLGITLKDSFSYNTNFNIPRWGALFFLQAKVGGCRESCDYTAYTFRALGIPTGIDFYLYSPQFEDGHMWNVVRDTTGQWTPFWYIDYLPQRGVIQDDRRKGKVYRYTFGMQPMKQKEIIKNPNVPPFFKNRFVKDVTDEYFGPNQLALSLDKKEEKESVAYLGVFGTGKWEPIDMASIHKNTAVFHNVEPEIISIPLYITDNTTYPAGYPFLFDGKQTNYFIPDTQHVETITLTRKYPIRKSIQTYLGFIEGVSLEASDRKDFTNNILLWSIDQTSTDHYYSLNLDKPCNYRYIRYMPPADKEVSLAEITFYTPDNQKVVPKVFHSCTTYMVLARNRVENIQDGDPLSFYHLEEKGCPLIFDFGQRTPIARIECIPRNDDNFIRPGDEYELFYHAGKKEWVSLGTQTAHERKLVYTNVPTHALLWLKDHTRGSEEQVFYIKDGKQQFPPGVPKERQFKP